MQNGPLRGALARRCDLLIAMDDDILRETLAIAGSERDQAW